MRKTRVLVAFLCATILLCQALPSVSALLAPTTPPSQTGSETPATSFSETLGPCHISEGEMLSYTTVSSQFAGQISMEGYYPGELTITLNGPIVIEDGGCLAIGTLSIGGSEASPVLSGVCAEGGVIIVQSGGTLQLTDVVFSTTGSGPLIIQEPGSSVELTMTSAEEGLIQWAPPTINNLNDSPDDLWIESGTTLTEDLLPVALQTSMQDRGSEIDLSVPLAWDLSEYDGQTDGSLTLSGSFLSEDGLPLLSVRPLEITVHWYTPGTLTVTSAEWKGDTVPTVELIVQDLPEDVEIWGETSTDNGSTWVRWEDEDVFYLVPVENSSDYACIFVLPDETPRLFRIVAEDPWQLNTYVTWRSESFALAPQDDDEDQGGNRGGSTTPEAPEREPEPADPPEIPNIPTVILPGKQPDYTTPADNTDSDIPESGVSGGMSTAEDTKEDTDSDVPENEISFPPAAELPAEEAVATPQESSADSAAPDASQPAAPADPVHGQSASTQAQSSSSESAEIASPGASTETNSTSSVSLQTDAENTADAPDASDSASSNDAETTSASATTSAPSSQTEEEVKPSADDASLSASEKTGKNSEKVSATATPLTVSQANSNSVLPRSVQFLLIALGFAVCALSGLAISLWLSHRRKK